ncbi:MAG: serine protease, partial [Cytophagales bacterium]|nr:serine protease [Cytophagales bacterium]
MLKNLGLVLVAFVGGIIGSWVFQQYLSEELSFKNPERFSISEEIPMSQVRHLAPAEETSQNIMSPVPDSFVKASENSTNSVVFIKNFSGTDSRRYSIFDYFFGQGMAQQTVSTGSGVIFSEDGYIITNNHVIEKAETIEVIHKKRTYKASLIGSDANTDIAVLKIEADNLPAIEIGSSRELKIGEWVLAVGKPFN